MSYVSSLKSKDNATKAVLHLPKYLRMSFLKKFTAENFDKENIDLIKLESSIRTNISSTFNPIASVTENEFKSKHNPKTSNFNTNPMLIDKDSLGNKQTHDKSKYTCWLCKGDHKISNCNKIKKTLVNMRSTFIKEHKRCFNYLSNDHMLNKCKSKVSSRIDGCKNNNIPF